MILASCIFALKNILALLANRNSRELCYLSCDSSYSLFIGVRVFQLLEIYGWGAIFYWVGVLVLQLLEIYGWCHFYWVRVGCSSY